ncbi:MAG: RecX family transcriptional regulator [Erysipelotrichaceae bacterium]|nr:RecX family transcriptional regulator [Erysipelotrichaceae bacterium]
MNIAIFSDTYLPDINGVATSTRILSKTLRAHGHNVLIVTPKKPSGSDYVDDEYVLRLPGIEVKKLYGYRASNIYSYRGMKEIRAFKPDVIHVQQEFGISIFGKIVGEILNIPVCYTYHTMYEDYTYYLSKNIKPLDFTIKKLVKRISKLYGESCAALIVPSEKTADVLRSYNIKNNIYIIPTGLELERFSPENKDENIVADIRNTYHLDGCFVLIYLGRLAKEKSIEMSIEAVERIKETIPNIRLLIVGGGPQYDELKALVDRKNLNDYIFFTGPKSPDLVPQYYHASDVFISASTTETQGLTYIEAMASGIPALARYDQNLENVIINGRNGYFFNNLEELIDLLKKLTVADLSELKKNAVKDVEKFSSEAFYTSIINVYNKAIVGYEYIYKVTDISKDIDGFLVTCRLDSHEIIINATQDTIDRYNLVIGQTINREELDALKDLEQMRNAYKMALKLLARKDYPYEKLRNRLITSDRFTEIQVDMAMQELSNHNLVNDYEYASTYIENSLRKGYGLKRAAMNLKKKGISSFVVDEVLLNYQDDVELEKAIDIVQNLYETNTKYSPKALVKAMNRKLFYNGFSERITRMAIDAVDIDYPEERIYSLLKREYERIYKRYSSRFSGHQLKNKIITFLVQKGYDYDMIINYLDEVWRDEDDN